jgi:hypothetical protein
MKKTTWKYLVDTLLFISVTGIAFIGILMAFFLAEGPTSIARDSEKYFLGLHRHQWGDIHLYLSLVFTALVVIHIILEWSWIKGKTRSLFKKAWVPVLVFIAALSLIVPLIFWAATPKHPANYDEYGNRSGDRLGRQQKLTVGNIAVQLNKEATRSDQKSPTLKSEKEHQEENKLVRGRLEEDISGILITGQMTLNEVEKSSGAQAGKIIEAMGLPPNTPRNESLGRLRIQFGFTSQELRDAVDSLMKKTYKTGDRPGSQQKRSGEITTIESSKEATRAKKEIPTLKSEEEHQEENKLVRGRLEEETSGILITGQMTLNEVEELTGISAAEILKSLGLPANASKKEALGRLRRRYGFTLQELRDVVASLVKKY